MRNEMRLNQQKCQNLLNLIFFSFREKNFFKKDFFTSIIDIWATNFYLFWCILIMIKGIFEHFKDIFLRFR